MGWERVRVGCVVACSLMAVLALPLQALQGLGTPAQAAPSASPVALDRSDVVLVVGPRVLSSVALRRGLSSTLLALEDESPDTRFAVVRGGSGGPSVVVDFTRARVAADVLLALSEPPAAVQEYAVLEAIRMVLGQRVRGANELALTFRSAARKELLVCSGSSSALPHYPGNRSAGQVTASAPAPLTPPWLDEIERTATLVALANATVHLVVEREALPTPDQLGDPSCEVLEDDALHAGETLAQLVTSGHGSSLQSRLLGSGLRSRAFELEDVTQGGFAKRLSQPITVLDCTAPTPSAMGVTPTSGSNFPGGTELVLAGSASRVDPMRPVLDVLVDGQSADLVDPDGSFFASLTVQPGITSYQITVVDACGQSTIQHELRGLAPGEIDFDTLSSATSSFSEEYANTSFNVATSTLHVDVRACNLSSTTYSAPLLLVFESFTEPMVSLLSPDGTTPDGHPFVVVADGSAQAQLPPADCTPWHPLSFHNPNQVPVDFTSSWRAGMNAAPFFVSVPVASATESVAYGYDVDASDPEGGALAYGLDVAPANMSIDPVTGVLAWTPALGSAGTHPVQVFVDDGLGGRATQSFLIEVAEFVNTDPEITSSPVVTATEGLLYEYDVEATDDDGDTLAYALAASPAGMSIDPVSGLISWTPDSTQSGSHPVEVNVDDGAGGSASQSFDVDVIEALNTAPEITSAPVTSGTEGTPYAYDVEATDDDGDTLTFSLDVAPAGMSVDPATGLVEWTPSSTDAGLRDVTVTADDGRGGVATQSYTIDVQEFLNVAPVITSSPVTTGGEGLAYSYDVEATDPDGDVLAFSLLTAPATMTIDPATGLVEWTPSGTDAGPTPVSIEVDDGRGGMATQSYSIDVAELVNNPPVITTSPVTAAAEDQLYQYDVDATDADGDPITFSLDVAPAGMTIDSTSGLVEWTPVAGQLGSNPVTVRASDDGGRSSTQSWSIDVTPDNFPPSITSAPPTTGTEGVAYTYQVVATDPDSDPLTYSLTAMPTGMTIDPGSGLVGWTPSEVQAGMHPVSLRVEDDAGRAATQSFTIDVAEGLNADPTITSSPVLAGTEGIAYQYDVEATDPENDVLAFSLCVAPAGMGMDPATGLIDWTPGSTQAGMHPVTVDVDDGNGGSDSQSFSVDVAEGVNADPTITSTPVLAGTEGIAYQYDVEATDPENDVLAFALSVAPAGMGIDPATGLIDWTPGSTQAGMHPVTVDVDDGNGGADSQSFTVDVAEAVNAPPTITSSPVTTGQVGVSYAYDVEATDPENDPLTFSLDSAPVGMGIDAGTGLIAWTPAAGQEGSNAVVVRVSDTQARSTQQSYSVDVLPTTNVSVPNVIGLTQALANNEILSAGLSFGPVSTRYDAQFAQGNVADQNPAPGTTVAPGTPVALTISLGQAPDIMPPMVQVVANPAIVDVGDTVVLTVVASDDVGVITTQLLIDGSPVALVGGQASFVAPAPGLYTATASATDAAGLSSSNTTNFQARTPVDDGPPSVALTSPANDATLESKTDLIGTATDSDLVYYDLEAAPVGTSNYASFFRGTSDVSNALLGELDPGLFPPGLYDVRVCAVDSWGNTACSAPQRYELSPVKPAPGVLSLAFLDGFADLAGLPIVIRRVYDSAYKVQGDFGIGWRLETQAVKLEATREMGADWAIQVTGTFFPTFTLVPTQDHRVNAFLPDGTVHRFRMRPDPQAQTIFPIDFLNGVFFDPLPGTTSTLTPNDQPFSVTPVLNNSGPVTIQDFNFEVFNPASYQLNLVDGRRFSFTQEAGSELTYVLTSATDAQGNTLTFGPNGISHSGGTSMGIVRDTQGRITSITNPEGEVRTYTYGANGDLVSVTDFEGQETQFVYNSSHGLLQVIDPRGYTPGTLIYNESGQIVAMIDPNGDQVDITYDAATNQQIITNRLGHTTVLTYDDAGNLVSELNALGEETVLTYDSNGNVLSRTNPLGKTETFTWDSSGNLLTYTNPLGHMETRTYDASNRLMSVENAVGAKTDYTYDASGNLMQMVTPNAGVFTMEYDASGNMTKFTDALGDAVQLVPDGFANYSKMTDPLGSETEFDFGPDGQLRCLTFSLDGQSFSYDYDYNANGGLVGVTMPDGSTSQVTRDAAGMPQMATSTLGSSEAIVMDAENKMLSRTSYDGTVTEMEYDAEGQVTAVDLPGNLRLSRQLDPVGRPMKFVQPDGVEIDFGYDSAGRVESQQRVMEGAFTFEYDDADRHIETIAPDGGSTKFEYDDVGQLTARIDPLGNRTEFEYSLIGSQTKTTLPDAAQVAREYDLIGRLQAIEDPLGVRIEYDYDAAGRLVRTTDPAGGFIDFTYDTVGSLETATLPSGATWTLDHNANGQKTSQTYPWGGQQIRTLNAAGQITELADPSGETATITYDAVGQVLQRTFSTGFTDSRTYSDSGSLTDVTDPGGDTHFTYDAADRLERVDHPGGLYVEYSYDAAGRISEVTTENGTTEYAYDTTGRLEIVTDSQLGVTVYGYDLAGRVTNIQHPDGTTTSITRNVRGGVDNVKTEMGSTVLRDTHYTYDDAGSLTDVMETGRTVSYSYDASGRLSNETRTGPDAANLDYDFDADWNLTQVGTRNLTYDGTLRLVDDGVFTSYTYDEGGRPVTRSNATVSEQLTYDAVGRLVRVDRTGQTPTTVLIEYDEAGLLRRIEADGVGRRYLWDDVSAVARLLEERDDSGALLRRYVHGRSPVGVVNGSGNGSIFHQEPTGSLRLITDLAGAVLTEYAFSAYGEQTIGASDTTSGLRFTGELYVPELGLYFLRSRFYDPVAGRFLTPDAIEPDSTIFLSYNPYQYGNANPAGFRDPLGTFSLSSTQISVSIAGILASLAINAFASPLSYVVQGLAPPPPAAATPVGFGFSVSVSGNASFAPIAKLSVGLSNTVLVGTSKSQFSTALSAGASLQTKQPKALITPGKYSFGFDLGLNFGQRNGDPQTPPQPGISLVISGSLAEKIIKTYAKVITPGILKGFGPVNITTIVGTQEFSNAGISLSSSLSGPTPNTLWDAFSFSGSPISTSNKGFVSTTFDALSPSGTFSGPIVSNVLPKPKTTLGIGFSASFPLFYFNYSGGLNFEGGFFWGF